jgi:hypothetical protein
MTRFSRRGWYLPAALLVLAACGGRSSGSGSSNPQPDQGIGADPNGTGEHETAAAGGPQVSSGTAASTEPEQPSGATGATEEQGAASVAGLHLELRAPKTLFAAGEALDLSAWLVNETAEPITVLRRASHVDLGLDASNRDGEFITSLLPPEPPPPPTAADLATIAPNGELELVDWELLNRVNQQIEAGNGRTGRFQVAARYHAGTGLSENLRQLDPAAWVGSLKSNSILIDVGE